MTDNPTMTAAQATSTSESWWDDAEAEECLPDGPVTNVATTNVIATSSDTQDQYAQNPTPAPSPYSLAGFYKSAVTHFWDRDALGLRGLGRTAVGTVLGESVAQSADQALDSILRDPGQALVDGAETLVPGSGEWVAGAEGLAVSAADALIAGAARFFDAPGAPSLGDFYAEAAASSPYSFVNAVKSYAGRPSLTQWSDGFDENAWSPASPYSWPYRFDTELNLWDANPIQAAPQSAIPVEKRASKTAKQPSVIVAVQPRRSYAYSAFAGSYSSFSASSFVSASLPEIETQFFFAPVRSEARSASQLEARKSESVPESLRSVLAPMHSVEGVSAPSVAAIQAESPPAAAATTSAQPIMTVSKETSEFAMGSEALFCTIHPEIEAAAVPAPVSEIVTTDVIMPVPEFAAREFGPARVASARGGIPLSSAPAADRAEPPIPHPARAEAEPDSSLVAAKRKEAAVAAERPESGWVAAPASVHGTDASLNPTPPVPVLTRESERFIFAAAWLLPRRSIERVSERDLAVEQSDVVDSLSRRHETVANLDDMNSDRDGSQHKPDWSQLLREQAQAPRLKTHRREESDGSSDDDGDDSAFRPARDAFVM